MKVYLDNCSYNRPFDNQSQIDYTQWQREHYAGMSVSKLNKKAVEYAKNNNNPIKKGKIEPDKGIVTKKFVKDYA